MTPERMKDLLNEIIDWVAIGENTHGQIEKLIQMGFTIEELTQEFNYSPCDIQKWLDNKETE